MSPSESMIASPSPRSSTRWIGRIVPLMLFPMLGLGLVGCFDLDQAGSTLRDSVRESTDGQWNKRIEIDLGYIPFAMARTGVAFLDDVEPEVRAALRSMRGVEVGVYHLASRHARPNRALVLEKTDQAMARRDHDRLVGVISDDGLVAVYAPTNSRSTSRLELSVLVLSEDEMVVVTATGNPEPLVKLALNHLHEARF